MVPLWLAALTLVAIADAAGLDDFPKPEDYLYQGPDTDAVSFSVSATLGGHMVLQRAPASAVVWGFAPSGTKVTTTFNGATYKTTAGNDTIWRQHLTPTAGGGPYTITISASSGETAILADVLFGDVYVCGGQSNMEFQLGINENASSYAEEAENYHDIRLFTVGQRTSSKVPLMDLKTVKQTWIRASAKTVTDFSAVCWFFGKVIHDGVGGKVPIGLVSNNWGGTRVEQWMSPSTSLPCGHSSSGELCNAMIVPYTVGPMAVTGFAWYQGESDLGGQPGLPGENNNYACTQAAQISQWRKEFQVPQAFYGIVQLSTWYVNPILLADLRDQQLETGDLVPSFAYATNADHGAGGNIHPPHKQYPGARLANAALSMVYNQPINWRSPTYASAEATGRGEVTVWLNDVTDDGLILKPPANAKLNAGSNCAALNAKVPKTCAWAELQFNDPKLSWVNATVSIGADKMTMVLTAAPPSGATGIIASSYGWGAVPMMTVYRADMDGKDGQLPVLAWNHSLTASAVGNADHTVIAQSFRANGGLSFGPAVFLLLFI